MYGQLQNINPHQQIPPPLPSSLWGIEEGASSVGQ